MKRVNVSMSKRFFLLPCCLLLSIFYAGFSIAANPNIKFEKRQVSDNKEKVYLNYTYDQKDVSFKGEEGEIPLFCGDVSKEEPVEYARYYLGKKEYDELKKILGPNLDNLGFANIQQGGYFIVSFQSYIQPVHGGIELKRVGETIEGDDVQWGRLIVSDISDVHIVTSWTPMKASPQEKVLVVHIIEKEPSVNIVKVTNGELHIPSLLEPVVKAGVHLLFSPEDNSFCDSSNLNPAYKWKAAELADRYYQLKKLQNGQRVFNMIKGCECGVFFDKEDKTDVQILEALSIKYLLKKEGEPPHSLSTVEALLAKRFKGAEINMEVWEQSEKHKSAMRQGAFSINEEQGLRETKSSEDAIVGLKKEYQKYHQVRVNAMAEPGPSQKGKLLMSRKRTYDSREETSYSSENGKVDFRSMKKIKVETTIDGQLKEVLKQLEEAVNDYDTHKKTGYKNLNENWDLNLKIDTGLSWSRPVRRFKELAGGVMNTDWYKSRVNSNDVSKAKEYLENIKLLHKNHVTGDERSIITIEVAKLALKYYRELMQCLPANLK